MLMALGCDLRQMGHADDLCALAQRTQFPADDFSHGATNAGVYFIEDHAARLARRARYLHRKRQARELAARGDLGERSQGLTRIGGDAKFNLVNAVHGRLGRGKRCDLNGKPTARHAKRLHPQGDIPGELAARSSAPCRKLLCERAVVFKRCALVLAQAGKIRVGTLKLRKFIGKLNCSLG